MALSQFLAKHTRAVRRLSRPGDVERIGRRKSEGRSLQRETHPARALTRSGVAPDALIRSSIVAQAKSEVAISSALRPLSRAGFLEAVAGLRITMEDMGNAVTLKFGFEAVDIGR